MGILNLQGVEKLLKALDERLSRAGEGGTVRAQSAESAATELRCLAALIDHTMLRPEATRAQVKQACDEARQWGFATVFVHSAWVPLASEWLHGSSVKTGSVAGFPFGANLTRAKCAEAEAAIQAGAQEIDMVINIGALRSGDRALAETDVRAVAEICRASGVTLKVILENAYLTEEQKVTACRLVQAAGADFVKTSTGLAASGATAEDVRLMRATVGAAFGVKAAGGIRTLADARRMLAAGANRLGMSASVAILEEASRRLSL